MAPIYESNNRFMTTLYFMIALAMIWMGWDAQLLVLGLVGLGLFVVLVIESLLNRRSIARRAQAARQKG